MPSPHAARSPTSFHEARNSVDDLFKVRTKFDWNQRYPKIVFHQLLEMTVVLGVAWTTGNRMGMAGLGCVISNLKKPSRLIEMKYDQL
jgi:hypothetical protein